MSKDITFEEVKVTDPYTFAQEWLDSHEHLGIARLLDEGRVQFRDLTTGRFTFSEDFWTEFRSSYAGGGP